MSKPQLEVCLSPALLHLYDLEGKAVVIIDIFRATTTILSALYHGALAVYPVGEIDQCIELGKKIHPSLTAGERDGFIAPGLEYGNSPSLYNRDFIEDKNLILTTTNGTRLLLMTQSADEILIGAFTNMTILAEHLMSLDKDVLLACASWKDRVNMEDSLMAGGLVHLMQDHFTCNCDSAQIVKGMYAQAQHQIYKYLSSAHHFNRLHRRGYQDDLIYCTTIDQNPIIASYDKEAENIVVKK